MSTDRARVQGRCPTCGPLMLLPRDLVCALPTDREAMALGEFHCPVCDSSVFNPMTPQEAKLLILVGAQKAVGPAPLEMTEEKTGPVLSIDDVYDLHVELEAMCCPQAELSGGAS